MLIYLNNILYGKEKMKIICSFVLFQLLVCFCFFFSLFFRWVETLIQNAMRTSKKRIAKKYLETIQSISAIKIWFCLPSYILESFYAWKFQRQYRQGGPQLTRIYPDNILNPVSIDFEILTNNHTHRYRLYLLVNLST